MNMKSSYANMLAGIPRTTQHAHAAVSVLDEILDDIRETPEFTNDQIETLCGRLLDTVRAAESPIESADSIVQIYEDYLQQNSSKDYNQLVSKFAATEAKATEFAQSRVTEDASQEENNDSSLNL